VWQLTGEVNMLTPQLVEKPELKIIGLEATFISGLSPDATNFQVIGPLWGQFMARANQVPNRLGGEMYGVMFDPPAGQRKHPHEMQYVAGVRVSSTAEVPDGMVARTVPATTFAVFTHRGTIKTIGDTLADIYRVWLPQSGYQRSGIADIELYDHRFHMDRADSEMEYWVSVVPKSPLT
jgi:AraC family transcriptional regulator